MPRARARADAPHTRRHAGTKALPIRYDFFAYLVRPILEAEYRTRRLIYRKTSPVAVLCGSDRSPFAPRPGSTEVERFVLMNIGSWCAEMKRMHSRSRACADMRGPRCAAHPSADSWVIKESNFVENYQQLPGGMVTIPDALLTEESAADGQPLRELVCNALRRAKADGEAAGEAGAVAEEEEGGGEGWADADWASVRAKLASERAASGPGMEWRLALPKNHVVAVRLTADVLSACFSHLGLVFNDQMAYYREETYKPGYCEFRVGDYAVRDVNRAMRPGRRADALRPRRSCLTLRS